MNRRRSELMRWVRARYLGLFAMAIALLLLAGLVAALEYSRPHPSGERLRFDSFVRAVERGDIERARILNYDSFIVGTYVTADGDRRGFQVPFLKSFSQGGLNSQQPIVNLLIENDVPFTIDQQVSKGIAGVLVSVFTGLIGATMLLYLVLSYRSRSGLFNVGSAGRRVRQDDPRVTFADVAGQDAAVVELQEIARFLSEPSRFAALGARIPKGVLLYGPPGSGKTLLARALAGEAGASFHYVSGSEFVELYAGVGASRVRELFREARERAPAIVFIDELDAIGTRRGNSPGSAANEEREQALNQILTELDGFSPIEGVVVIGATNRPDVLDPALLRPGRFDRSVALARTDEPGRLAILRVHAAGRPLAPDADLADIANLAVGLTGADLANLLNEAGLLAARAGAQQIGHEHLREALRRIAEAPERQRRMALRSRNPGRGPVSDERVTFSDVAGVDEVIEELADVRDFLDDPDRFARMGARTPKGFLMCGPPGCGKTLLARALATEANAAFFWLSGSEFAEIYVGEGAGRVRDLFAEARAMAPSIVFIDELDAVGAQRSSRPDGGSREVETTLNQLLVELDGFGERAGVVVMAATNRPELLDAALIRRGRFDRIITFSLPDREARRAILGVHAAGKPLEDETALDALAAASAGLSGADLAAVLNESALLAARRREPVITRALLDEALERIVHGAIRGRTMTPEERRIAACHEAGHAIVSRAVGGRVPYRLTIMPRGEVLGSVSYVDGDDRRMHSRSSMVDEMAAVLGGRAAEELLLGEAGSGGANDLARVAEIAQSMVREMGMGAAGANLAHVNGWSHSQETAERIDAEVAALVEEAHARAMTILRSSQEALERVAAELVERETLDQERFEALAAASALPQVG